MYTTLGWVLLAGLPLSNPATNDTAVHAPARPPVAAGRVAVWSDRDDPYDRGEGARVYLSAPQAAHVAVFRVDTDGRIRVLFPREPWGDTWVRESSKLEVPGGRGGRSFVVDDDPGDRLSLRDLVAPTLRLRRHRAGRLLGLSRHRRRPHHRRPVRGAHRPRQRASPRATTTITTSAPTTWNDGTTIPGSSATTATPTPSTTSGTPIAGPAPDSGWSIYDDPRYYPYRLGRGRNVVIEHAHRPEPRFVFRDADRDREYVTRVTTGGGGEYRYRQSAGRTSRDVGGRGAVPVPGLSSDRRAPAMAPPLRVTPAPPAVRENDAKDTRRRRIKSDTPREAADRQAFGAGAPAGAQEHRGARAAAAEALTAG